MRAVLPRRTPVDLELPAASRADLRMEGSPVDQIKMVVPPLVPALVTAEYLFLPLRNLVYLHSAVPARRDLPGELDRLSPRLRHSAESVPPAVGLDGIGTYPQLPGNRPVPIPVRSHHCDS